VSDDLLDLNDQFLRSLAVALLEAVPNGNPLHNVAALASFNTNLMAGLIFGGASTKEQAMEGIEAYANDLRKLIGENFDDAKAAMEKADQEKEEKTH
jgi:hypothetical protein